MIDRYITHAARNAPFAPAIATLHGDVTFQRFDREISLFAAWVRTQALDGSRPVVVSCADRYLHWLLLLAFARCDVATASVSALTPKGVVAAIAPQLFVTDEAASSPELAQIRSFVVTPDWVRHVLSDPSPGYVRERRGDPDRLVRISTSSGTTGVPKRIGFSGREVDRRLPSLFRLGGAAMMRFLPLVGPESGGFEACLSVWSSLGTVVLPPQSAEDLGEGLRRLAPSLLAGAPIQLQHVLGALPAGATPLFNLRVTVFGAHTPMALRREISLRLSADIHNAFGATECGLVAGASVSHLSDPASAGFVFPWVELEIVDDDDQPCGKGELGRLRVRSSEVASGYMDDPQASAGHFKAGWFYPGDTGSLSREGMLRLEGRSNEVINAGGEKMLPLQLEAAALDCRGVHDAAGFMAPGAGGAECAWIALVARGDVDRAEMSRRFSALGAPAVNLAWVEAIPRNERGKIRRDELRAQLVRRQAQDRLDANSATPERAQVR